MNQELKTYRVEILRYPIGVEVQAPNEESAILLAKAKVDFSVYSVDGVEEITENEFQEVDDVIAKKRGD